MAKAIAAEEQGLDRASDREISMALFGLQRMGSGPAKTPGQGLGMSTKGHGPGLSVELKHVLAYLGSLLDTFNQPFEARRLGFAIMGLSGLPGNQPEVLHLVGQLSARAEQAWGDLNSQVRRDENDVVCAVHGMKNCVYFCCLFCRLLVSLFVCLFT